MTFQQLWNAATEHNESLDNPFVNPSDEVVKEINDYWALHNPAVKDE